MNMDSDPENLEIVKVIVTLAHNLGLKVVAEGAETEAHVKQLLQLNCEQAQGYFFSRPADEKAMTQLLAASPGVRSAAASR
jgi:EAL domain-containing protein (putative c-di-GMP-specific phosphodiesterase class I)